MIRYALILAIAAFVPSQALAQVAPSPTPSASATPVPSATPFVQLSAYAESAYASVAGADAIRFLSGAPAHIFDTATGPFFDSNGGRRLAPANDANATLVLQNINLQAVFDGGGALGGKIETSFGPDADVLASNGQSRSGVNLTQAYAQYAKGHLVALAGKFLGLAGYEVGETINDTNYSRDFLYGAVLSTETGLRLTYAFDPKISFVAGVSNGWDDWKFTGKRKTLEASLALTPSPAISLNLTTYTGGDFFSNGDSTRAIAPIITNRSLYDGVLTVHATPTLTLAANYDRATQLGDGTSGATSQQWAGIAGYLNYQFSPRYALSLRKETFRDAQGFRTGAGVPVRLQSNTATLALTPNPSLLFRVEYRLDAADGEVFAFRHVGHDPAALATGRPKTSEFALDAVVRTP